MSMTLEPQPHGGFPPQPTLALEGLGKRFGSRPVVQDVTFEVWPGEILGFLGPNGAGKTTTLGMALGLVWPTAGRVRVLGSPVTPNRNAALERVGMVLGAPALYPHLGARTHLDLLGRLRGRLDRERAGELLDRVGLGEASRRPVSTYSTGMRQRLGLALALLHRPALLLLDEPISGMDPHGIAAVRELLRDEAAQGTAVVLSSHQLAEVEQLASRVVVLHGGRVVGQGALADLMRPSGVRVVVSEVTRAMRILCQAVPGLEVQAQEGALTVANLGGRQVIDLLVAGGCTPDAVVPVQGRLEDVFTRLTAGSAA